MNFPDQQYTERANRISENAIRQSIPIYNRLVEHFKGLIEASESFGEAQRITALYALDKEFIAAFQEKLFEAMVVEDALGRSYLVEKDRAASAIVRRTAAKFTVNHHVIRASDVGWFLLKDERIKITFDLVPESAIKQMRERSFWIAGIENDAILERVQNALIESIAKGETWEDFKKRAERIFEELKAAPLQPHRLQNVFRTNLFSSYAKAQIEQLQSMQERFPLWRYVAILDGATRPQHRAWNGTIWRIGEGPYPPLRNGEDAGISFNCRCSAQHIHLYEAERLEASKSLKIESGEPFSLQQILTDERAAFQRYIADVRPHLNDKIHDHIQHSI